MRVMVFVKATEDSEKGFKLTPETKQMMAEMEQFNEELIKAGILKPGECDGLTPSSQGKRVSFDGSNRTVTAGPFLHPRELVTGFWIWTVEDMEEAVAWVKRCPNPMSGPSDIEIRPFQTIEDFT